MCADVIVSCVERREELASLEAEWERLLSRSDVASPFLTFGWQAAWLDSYGKRHSPFVLVGRVDGSLVGLWPLARIARGFFRVLEPIGARRSDWLDVLTTSTHREAVQQAFLGYLESRKADWDLVEHRDVLTQSPTLRLLKGASARLPCRWQTRTAAPYLELAGTWEEFLRSKRSKFRSNLKYYRRLAERQCSSFTITRHSGSEVDRVVDEMAEVERKSWKAKRGNLKVSTEAGRSFYSGFCAYFAKRGQLDIWRADCDGRLIAFLVNINFAGKCYHYNTCFDQEHGNISPGLLLHGEAISDAFSNHRSEYDFLSGDEPYKDRWSSGKREICHVALHNDRLRSRAAFLVLVGARWAFRRSGALRQARMRVLSAARAFSRVKARQ